MAEVEKDSYPTQSLNHKEDFQALADYFPNLAWLANADGSVYWYNKPWYEYTNTNLEEMLGWGWQKVHHPDYVQGVTERFKNAVDQIVDWEDTFPLKGGDGKFRWFLTRAVPIKNAEGVLIKWFGTNTDITERIESEQATKRSKMRFEGAVQAIEGVLWTTNTTGEIVGEQPGWEKLTGQSFQDCQGYGWANAVHPDDSQPSIDAWDDAIRHCKPYIFEHRLKVKSGEYRHFSIRAIPLLNADQTIQEWVGIHTDITERKTHELALAENQNMYRSILEESSVGAALITGPEFRIEYINDIIARFWGKDNSIVGQTMAEAMPELRWQYLLEQLENVYTTGITFSGIESKANLVVDGVLQTLYFNFTFKALRNLKGDIYGIHHISQDVTQQIKARNVIENEYLKFKTLSDAMPQFVWTATPDGDLDFLNKQWFVYSGYSQEQSIGAGWGTSIYVDDMPALSEKWTHSLKTGEPYQVEARICRADGIYRWHLIRAVAIKENDNIMQWVGTTTDIDDQKKYEIELNQLSNELAALNEELVASNEEISDTNNQLSLINADLDNFIYTASHDLKAPIANIEGLMNALIEDLPAEVKSDSAVEMMTQMINDSIDRFKKTINQLTNITQLQNEYNIETGEIQVNEILAEVLLDLRLIINKSSAQIIIEESTTTSVLFSEKNLRSILYNLISNGIKYRSSERIPNVTISCKDVPGFKVLSITDNGLGIPLFQQSKLFSMFVRMHDHVEGSGVGLYIVKKMAENAGGKIEVESNLGVGSTFNVYFKTRNKI